LFGLKYKHEESLHASRIGFYIKLQTSHIVIVLINAHKLVRSH